LGNLAESLIHCGDFVHRNSHVSMSRSRSIFSSLAAVILLAGVSAEAASREEALQIARAYAEHQWTPSAKNIRHGRDSAGIEVQTPDSAGGTDDGHWTPGQVQTGMAYKWGGFDTIQSFDAGIRKGKGAGDLYSAEKRRKGGAAVSAETVGVDCSGFVSRCWSLGRKQSTSTLPSICKLLASPAELLPGDILNQPGGHVVLFAGWLDERRTRGSFYEAEPFSKVIRSEYEIAALTARGFKPMRYRQMRD
jgi:hypothetical protein